MSPLGANPEEGRGLRTSARVVGGLIAGLLVLFGIGYLFEGKERGSSAPEPLAIFGLSLLGLYVIGLMVAFKWQRIGAWLGAAALAAIFALLLFGVFPGTRGAGRVFVLLNPFMLALWVPIILYLLHGRQRI